MMGVIGGTGLYRLDGLSEFRDVWITTPFGNPSAPIRIGIFALDQTADVIEIAFLPRHGVNHQWLPGEINYAANIWALKSVGVKKILSVSAVGSLVDGIHPGDFSLVDQYLDFTKGGRRSSFFGEGLVGHVSMAQPVCQSLSMACLETMEKMNIRVHEGKTYACVEGPRLGTKAESHFLRKSGGDLVGMTHVPEAFLAREAQLCYGALAVVTDYDCWKEDVRESANLDSILKNYGKTIEKVQDIIKGIFLRAKADNFARCSCSQALAGAILTQRDALTEEKRQIYDFLSR